MCDGLAEQGIKWLLKYIPGSSNSIPNPTVSEGSSSWSLMGRKTDSQGVFPGPTPPGASGVWASLFHGMLSKACSDHFPGLQGPALTPPVSLKVSAGRRMRTLSQHHPPLACLLHQGGGGTLSCLNLEQRLGQDASGQGPWDPLHFL